MFNKFLYVENSLYLASITADDVVINSHHRRTIIAFDVALDLGAGEGLHTLHPQFLNCLLELLLLTTSALGEGTLHVDMFLEAFIHLRLGLLDVGLALSLKTTLDFL